MGTEEEAASERASGGKGEAMHHEPPERSALLWNINKQISSDLVPLQYWTAKNENGRRPSI